MVQSKVRDESDYRYPDDAQYPGKLLSVEERVIEFVYKATSPVVTAGRARAGEAGKFSRWRWTFAFVGGEFEGDTVYLETEAGLSTRSDSKARQIAETLLGREMGIGEDFNSDAIVGLPCLFTIAHDEPVQKKNGEMGFYCSVEDVFPATAGDYDAPPF